MRGQKLAVAILTIIEAVWMFGILFIIWGLGFMGVVGATNPQHFAIGWTAIVAMFFALTIVYLVLGAMFIINKPNKRLARVLLVVNVLIVTGVLFFIILFAVNTGGEGLLVIGMGLVPYLITPIVKIILLVSYLKKFGTQKVAPWETQQFTACMFCGKCGTRREFNDKHCKTCGGRLH